jgi:hypothetical protein
MSQSVCASGFSAAPSLAPASFGVGVIAKIDPVKIFCP